ncbi:hypothetical protein AVEN_126486-1 [Araneus ventricosus]|uniref:Uncharacterized protein n=1 Tax=Araneus ventricosus TaxID=182803 RepID=A0A4Y2WK20_ARAVE|nr:hypothetical protein AVEN_14935-1 [Araneus ventricosus]GBO37864.1 hypothetical protein AVEN_126486-1 [Araneus ventricosus]
MQTILLRLAALMAKGSPCPSGMRVSESRLSPPALLGSHLNRPECDADLGGPSLKPTQRKLDRKMMTRSRGSISARSAWGRSRFRIYWRERVV